MRTIEISDATAPLSEYACDVKREPLVLTIDGIPIAALVPIEPADLETISLSTKPRFIDLIERSRARQRAGGGMSSEETRWRLRQA